MVTVIVLELEFSSWIEVSSDIPFNNLKYVTGLKFNFPKDGFLICYSNISYQLSISVRIDKQPSKTS